ncbi:GldG family protein [Akkermansiaceae bacterium]|nr:GldG family protein [Akkermansiaceae bacterium]MDA8967450.1 GldG family protein [Akkermansiaceae bacterium]MDB4462338.1 GldG family protein [Akkermansiaceae bacterium]MDB4545533.1 GldG family protein [Akkermansiaceae bacterium]MDB4577930.1 GldG family protein [Akkermansiaceae bacterium]
MIDDPKTNLEEMAPPPSPITRLGTRSRVLLQLVLAVIILVSAFYIGIIYHTQKDLTHTSEFTLSEETLNLLGSSAISKREEPVKIIAALRKNSPHYARLRNLIEQYENLAKGKIAVDYLDPIRDQDRAVEVANNYYDTLGQLFSDDIFIIDGRLSPPVDPTSPDAGLSFVRVQDMLVMRTDENKQRRVAGYQDEAMLTSYLLAALEPKPRIMYLISDKNDIDASDTSSPAEMLKETMGRLNVFLAPIRISEVDEIPANAEGVVFAAPQYDLSTEELQKVDTYWKRPNSSILAYLDPSAELPNLNSFLRRNGVTPRNDRILKVSNGRTDSQVQALFSINAPVNDVTVSLEGKAARFEGRVSSLEIREGAEDLVTQGIRCFAVIETAPGYWGEVDYKKPNPTFDDSSDQPGPLFLGAGIIRGNASLENEEDTASKMIILSTSDFLNPERLNNEQLDFVKNTTHWLLGREELMGIGPRGLVRRKLNLIPSEVSWLQNIIVFFIPAGFLMISLFVWSIRRA